MTNADEITLVRYDFTTSARNAIYLQQSYLIEKRTSMLGVLAPKKETGSAIFLSTEF